MIKGLLVAGVIVALGLVTGVLQFHPENLASVPGQAIAFVSQFNAGKSLMAKLPVALPSGSPSATPSPAPQVKGAQDTKPAPTQQPKATEKPAETAIPLQF